jgi:phage baseplate assembly protein W
MAKTRYINIDFPFRDSDNGFYFKMNKTDKDAIRADLLHLLLTNKGERLYSPDFGSDLKKYIFEPNDSITQAQIRDNLNETIKIYIPNLIVNDISFRNDTVEESIIVELKYTVTEGTFVSSDTITLTF